MNWLNLLCFRGILDSFLILLCKVLVESLFLCRQRIMPMTKRVHRRKGETVVGERDVGGVNITTITTIITVGTTTMWEPPLQIIWLLVSSQLRPSNLLGLECQMEREDLPWVEESQLLLILHDVSFNRHFSTCKLW